MVIYWFGFVESALDLVRAEDIGVVITDSFPEYWMFPTGELAHPDTLPVFCVTNENNIADSKT